MKAALDVHYEGDRATAACVVFDRWRDSTPRELVRVTLPSGAQYRPGRFFERELPCLLAVLDRSGHAFETIVIDGYVHLRADRGKGLGQHLREALACAPVVVGVAKSPLKIADRFVSIHRGRSQRPLFVSAAGCSLDAAGNAIFGMHGPYRIPTLLKLADRHARGSQF